MQYFNVECYCENAQVLGFPDFKYSTLLGVTRQFVFFEYVTAAEDTLTPGGDTRRPAGSLRGTGAAEMRRNSRARSSPLRPPREEPASVADLSPLPRQRGGAPGGRYRRRESPPGMGAPQEVGRRAGAGTLNTTPAYARTYSTEGSKPGKRRGRGAYARCGQPRSSPALGEGIPPSGDPLARLPVRPRLLR